MTTLPNGWAVTTLAEVTLPYETIDPNRFPDTQFSYIDIGSIDNHTQTIRETKSFTGKDAPSRARRIVKEGDVLFSTVRTYLKNIAIVPKGLEGQLTSTGIAILRPNEAVDGRYLFNWVCSDDFISTMSKEQDGTLYPAVTDKDVARGTIPLPPLPEQKRIVAKVDGLSARTARARAELERIPTLIARYKQRLLALAFSGELTADWRVEQRLSLGHEVSLSSVTTGFSYGSSAKSEKSGLVPVLRMGNIQQGKLDWSDLVFTSDKAEIKKYTLFPGDILFNRTNSPELVGKTALYRGERPATYAGYLIRIQCSKKLLPEFLTYCLNGPDARAYCWQVKTDGVSQSNINAKKIAAFRFLLPSIAEQIEIVRRIEAAFAWLDRMATEHRAASTLMPKLDAAILAKAFRGELVPQDPNDEPASALLERIKSEQQIARTPTRKRKRLEADNAKPPPTFVEMAPRLTPDRVYIARDQFQLSLVEKSAMSKSRQDEDVMGKPYLASLIKHGLGNTVQDLFKASDLPVADFYKQLAWEIDQKHILDNDQKLEAA